MPAFFFHLVFDFEPVKQIQSSGSSKPPVSLPSRDWRYDLIFSQTISMPPASARNKHESKIEELASITNGMNDGPRGLATKGRFEPAEPQDKKLGWGVVRLYRDSQETPSLYDEPLSFPHGKHARAPRSAAAPSRTDPQPFRDEECTTLCILAVPSYLTPSDFLGFVGEKTRDEVSHFRMIRTEKSNRYMVLMRFRNGKKAREWRREWNGKGFDGMEPENCHVVFVKSISYSKPPEQSDDDDSSFPDMRNDPFTPLSTNDMPSSAISPSTATATRSTKPIPPPTPALIELPTCPVCLERMDESTGLLTILCQHVFHCSCLQKWRGSGCPVCRYTQSPSSKYHTPRPLSHQEAAATGPLNECAVCHSESNLWICLICGNTGCGRYDAAHAFQHYEETGHCFAMDMGTQRVWDYAGDGYVHRILQDKTDGKFLECEPDEDDSPHNAFDSESHDADNSARDGQGAQGGGADEGGGGGDSVPRSKLDKLSHEYTSLLTSQLDSQRQYFHRMIAQAADKSHHLQLSNQESALSLSSLQSQLDSLQAAHQTVLTTTLPDLEKEKSRAETKAKRFEDMARRLEREWRDEKAMNSGLVEKVARLESELGGLRDERRELAEVVRDLQFFVSGAQKVREMGGEIEGGDVGLPPDRRRLEEGEVGKAKGGKKGKGGKK